jgi:hypothetical protein
MVNSCNLDRAASPAFCDRSQVISVPKVAANHFTLLPWQVRYKLLNQRRFFPVFQQDNRIMLGINFEYLSACPLRIFMIILRQDDIQ